MAVIAKKQISEQWFERYCRDHGLAGGEDHHPDLGQDRKPDYRVSRGPAAAICEVKEFMDSKKSRRLTAAQPNQAITLSSDEEYGSVRNTISKASKEQLSPFQHRGEALMVVLANPHSVFVSLEHPDDIIAAMYGNQAYRIAVDLPPGQEDAGELVFTADGVLTSKHRYVSAVATLHLRSNAADALDAFSKENQHRWAEIEDEKEALAAVLAAHEEPEYRQAAETIGDYVFIRVYSTISTITGHAVPVPRSLFNGPHDQYWAMNEQAGALELVHGTLDLGR